MSQHDSPPPTPPDAYDYVQVLGNLATFRKGSSAEHAALITLADSLAELVKAHSSAEHHQAIALALLPAASRMASWVGSGIPLDPHALVDVLALAAHRLYLDAE